MAARQRRAEQETPSTYVLKVTLVDVAPPIWRRFQVPGTITLEDLHEALQVVMGWENYHLWEFTIAGVGYGPPDPEGESEAEDASQLQLQEVVRRQGSRFHYLYDFGDGWEHDIQVEKILPSDGPALPPLCLAGQRACPPEDCGGSWGYQELLEALQDPDHEQHEEMKEWVGEEFDPEAFDLEEVNLNLAYLWSG